MVGLELVRMLPKTREGLAVFEGLAQMPTPPPLLGHLHSELSQMPLVLTNGRPRPFLRVFLAWEESITDSISDLPNPSQTNQVSANKSPILLFLFK